MGIPTEPIGSIPRPAPLIAALAGFGAGEIDGAARRAAQDDALQDTLRRFEATGSPVVTDGEQGKPSFATYPIDGMTDLDPSGITIPFEDGHTRQLPVLTRGPFGYRVFADTYLRQAKTLTKLPVKQAVIAPSALSLLYPPDGVAGYSQAQFLADLERDAVADIRRCLDAGAHKVQLDFTEGRLSLKLDPSKAVLRSFIELNNRVLAHFSPSERTRIGVHTCPGGDHDSTHSLDIDYAELLPDLFRLNVGNFYLQLASEADPGRVLSIVAEHAPATARIFVGVIDPINPEVETPEEVAERVVQAAAVIDPSRLGTCDDCGFSPFADDTSTSRDTAFEKIRSRVLGTELAAKQLGL
jgi:5-methyltetrahydropteroyltriglutamate--homocysteine methyltransferase